MKVFFKKRTVVVLVLVLLLALVGYINYNFIDQVATSENNFENAPINAELVDSQIEEEIMAGSQNITKDFFVEYKIEREQNRSEHIAVLENIVNNEGSNEETRDLAQQEMIKLVQLSEKEMIIENLIRAKGFNDIIVFIHDGYVNVVVDAYQLTQAQAAQIQDIINKESGIEVQNISIATSNNE